MIAFTHFIGSTADAQALCAEKEAAGWEIVSVSSSGERNYLITLRGKDQPTTPALGSRLQKGLRLATARLSAMGGMGVYEMSSLSALADGRESVHDMDVIESALARLGK